MLSAGTRLGPYEILTPLGAGGMGEVYKARDTRLDRTVAIKVLPPHLSGDPQFRDRFDREARAISQLTHPHICALYDVGQAANPESPAPSPQPVQFLVMELLDGETLTEKLARVSTLKSQGSGAPQPSALSHQPSRGLALDEAVAIAIQIASALDAAHRAGITHRDLKPGNVMLAKTGAKLLDFGLAKTASRAVSSVGHGFSRAGTAEAAPYLITAQGTILGTFQYMAPEQLEGKEADARTDLFAFGAVLYEMLTGKKAFEGKSHASLIAAILEHDPPPLAASQPLTPPALDRVVRKCLAKDPDRRWQSAGDLHDELTWIAEGGDAASNSSAAIGAPPRTTRERAWTWIGAASLIVAFAAVSAAVMVWRRPAPELPLTRLDLVTPPTTDPFSFALSPDARQIVFVATAEGTSKLWVRPLDQTTAQALAGTDGASAPFWAPDGRAIGFFADAKLKRIDLSGGTPQVLADAPSVRGGTWNHAGVIVFAPTTSNPDAGRGRGWGGDVPDAGCPRPDESSVAAVPARRAAVPVLRPGPLGHAGRVLGVSWGELFYRSDDRHLVAVPVRTVPTLELGVPVALFVLNGSASWTDFDVAADGKRFLAIIPEIVGDEQPLNVIVNWTAELGRRPQP